MHPLLTIVKVATVIIGLIVSYLAYRGYVRNSSLPMLFVAFGFILLSTGTICGSILKSIIGLSHHTAALIESSVMASGMVSVLYSLTK